MGLIWTQEPVIDLMRSYESGHKSTMKIGSRVYTLIMIDYEINVRKYLTKLKRGIQYSMKVMSFQELK